VSATPGPYELAKTGGKYVEQIIRPTGLLDPEIEVAPARSQVPALARTDSPAVGRRRASAGDHAHQAIGRRPGGLSSASRTFAANGCTAIWTPLSGSNCSATCGWASSTCWWASTCCARPRSARGLAGGHPRRRQGGLFAERNVVDADHRPLGPQYQRQGVALWPTE